MLGSLLSSFAGTIGSRLGGGILGRIGRYAGKSLGNYLEKKWFYRKRISQKYKNAREGFLIERAKYGTAIPLIFGRTKVDGK
jgi:membrane protein DedA with SNARE-associated domain